MRSGYFLGAPMGMKISENHTGGMMIAYYVYDEKKEDDTIVLPDMGCSVSVTADIFEKFISVEGRRRRCVCDP